MIRARSALRGQCAAIAADCRAVWGWPKGALASQMAAHVAAIGSNISREALCETKDVTCQSDTREAVFDSKSTVHGKSEHVWPRFENQLDRGEK